MPSGKQVQNNKKKKERFLGLTDEMPESERDISSLSNRQIYNLGKGYLLSLPHIVLFKLGIVKSCSTAARKRWHGNCRENVLISKRLVNLS
jgi:hypothetical protein